MGVESPQSPKPGTPAARVAAAKSGIVIPHTLNWPRRFLARMMAGFMRIMGATLRGSWEFAPEILTSPHPVILVTWHNRLALSMLMSRGYARHRQQPQRLAALVSASKDGALLARILELFGVQPVRGSTSRRGPQALLELTTWSEQGYDLAVTPDGPRGPRYIMQPGALALAQVTGCCIIPASNYVAWKVCLKSWDRFQIPLPFSRAVFRFGQPLYVPREATDGQREALRQELEKRLLSLTQD